MSVSIRLNGSNYVSEKTRLTFEKALADGHQVTLATSSQPPASPAAPAESREPAPSPAPQSVAVVQEPEPTMPALADYTRLLDSLNHGLAQSHEHQSQTLHVHEQYLGYQAEYAKLFTQLLQQQGDIFTHGQVSPQQAELAAKVLDNLSHSMARFHDLQSDTLSVHKQFLDQQADYAQGQVDLLRQQAALAGAATPAPQAKLPGRNGSQPKDYSHTERHEIHRSHAYRGGNGHGNGNGHSALPAAIIEAASGVHASPVAHPKPHEMATAAAPQPAAQAASPAPAAPKPSVQAAPAAPTVAPGIGAATLTPSLIAIVSEKTGYPADMLELAMDMEADLGIDSIKRVEIMGALQNRHPDLPKVEPQALAELRTLGQIVDYVAGVTGSTGTVQRLPAAEPPTAASQATLEPAPVSGAATEDLTASLLAIVSEKTGYPADMLELAMDMEADLGIDSIKRVEIMGALQDRYPDLPKVEPQALAELRTLGQIVSFIGAEPAAKKA